MKHIYYYNTGSTDSTVYTRVKHCQMMNAFYTFTTFKIVSVTYFTIWPFVSLSSLSYANLAVTTDVLAVDYD